MDGEISVESVEGAGSTFIVVFPAATSNDRSHDVAVVA